MEREEEEEEEEEEKNKVKKRVTFISCLLLHIQLRYSQLTNCHETSLWAAACYLRHGVPGLPLQIVT